MFNTDPSSDDLQYSLLGIEYELSDLYYIVYPYGLDYYESLLYSPRILISKFDGSIFKQYMLKNKGYSDIFSFVDNEIIHNDIVYKIDLSGDDNTSVFITIPDPNMYWVVNHIGDSFDDICLIKTAILDKLGIAGTATLGYWCDLEFETLYDIDTIDTININWILIRRMISSAVKIQQTWRKYLYTKSAINLQRIWRRNYYSPGNAGMTAAQEHFEKK